MYLVGLNIFSKCEACFFNSGWQWLLMMPSGLNEVFVAGVEGDPNHLTHIKVPVAWSNDQYCYIHTQISITLLVTMEARGLQENRWTGLQWRSRLM